MSLAPTRGWATPRCASCRVIIISDRERAERIAEAVRSRGFNDVVIYDPSNVPVVYQRHCTIIIIPPFDDAKKAEAVARRVFYGPCMYVDETCIAEYAAKIRRGVIIYGAFCRYGVLNDVVL